MNGKEEKEDLVVLWVDRSDVIKIMQVLMLYKASGRGNPDELNRIYDELNAHLFKEVKDDEYRKD